MKNAKRILATVLVIACLLGLALIANAVNSYMPLWEHVPDGEPHVFGDRVYVYGSHDVFESRMCGPNYVVWSAPVDDLTDWTYHGISFDGGESGYLLAPDVIQGPDGKYYLYAFGDCDQAGGVGSTFMAVSEKPEGPFEYVGPVLVNGKSAFIFDPAALTDDDGSVYLFGGSSNIYKLDPTDMRTAIEGPYQVQELNDKGELVQIRDFQEGSSIRKVGDWYVFVYAAKYDLNTGKWYTNNVNNADYYNGTLQYAYSKNIYGPYTYGGLIIDNGGEMLHPSANTIEKSYYNGNTHGGIAEINGQWYVFYHRQTTDKQTYRQAMCEPLNMSYDDKGVYIEQAEMTSQGAEKDGLKAEKEYSAGIACYLTRGAYVNTDVEMYDTRTPVVNIKNSAKVGYKYIAFEGEDYALNVKVKPMGVAGKIAVVLDDPENDPVAMLDVPAEASEEDITLTANVGEISGKHAVFFNFYATSQNVICEFSTFEFKKSTHDCPSKAFTDLNLNADDTTKPWYHEGVDYMVANGIMNGMTDTTFVPNGNLTRGQLVTMLYRIEGEPKVDGKSNPFTDVAAGRFYTDAIIWAADKGIVNGITDTTYQPEADITREQLATILYRYAEADEVNKDNIAKFPDAAQVGNYAKDALNWAIEEGIISGVESNGVDYIQPKNTATRAQVATMLYRYLAE